MSQMRIQFPYSTAVSYLVTAPQTNVFTYYGDASINLNTYLISSFYYGNTTSSAQFTGVMANVTSAGFGNLSAMVGVAGEAFMSSPGTMGNLVGVLGLANCQQGTTTYANALSAASYGSTAAGASVTYAMGVRINSPSTVGPVSNAYGLYIASISGAVGANYSIYTNLGPVYFSDLLYANNGINFNNGGSTFNQYQQGTFVPTFTGLTVVNGTGGVTYSGRYTRIGNRVDFQVEIIVSGNATTAAVNGTTKISNLPFVTIVDSIAQTLQTATNVSTGPASVQGATTSCFMPTWSAVNSNIVITGTLLL